MNWATLAPETRLYKGKNLFRWEDSPGLEHHCGVCATPLHNSRAKTSCIGKHVEPCYRFHQQLHFVGKSHECFGCNSSDECHHGRHKEILKLVRQVVALDRESSIATPSRDLFGKPKRGSDYTTSSTVDTSSESQLPEEPRMTRSQRKKLKKSGNNSVKDKKGMEVFPQEELDFISEAIHLTVHESKGAWEGTYNYDHKQPETESAIEEETNFETDTASPASSVNDLAVKPPADMTPRQRRVQKRFHTPMNQSSFSGGSRKYGVTKTDPYDGLDPEIFSRLGVEISNPANDSKERRELTAKLVEAVKDDINTIKRESDDTVMREAGFWRWAGRTVMHQITATRENLDWATGQKINPKLELPDDDMDLEGAIDDRPLPINPEPEPKLAAKFKTKPTPAAVAREEDDDFTIVASKKPAVEKKKGKTSIPLQTRGYKKALYRPLLPNSPEGIETAVEEGAEDLREMMRRHEQKTAGGGMLGKWVQPSAPYYPPRNRSKK